MPRKEWPEVGSKVVKTTNWQDDPKPYPGKPNKGAVGEVIEPRFKNKVSVRYLGFDLGLQNYDRSFLDNGWLVVVPDIKNNKEEKDEV